MSVVSPLTNFTSGGDRTARQHFECSGVDAIMHYNSFRWFVFYLLFINSMGCEPSKSNIDSRVDNSSSMDSDSEDRDVVIPPDNARSTLSFILGAPQQTVSISIANLTSIESRMNMLKSNQQQPYKRRKRSAAIQDRTQGRPSTAAPFHEHVHNLISHSSLSLCLGFKCRLSIVRI